MYTVKCFQVLLFNSNNSIKHQSFVYTQLNDQTVLFKAIQFSISHLFALSLNVSFIWSIDRTLSGATTLGQIGSESNSNEGVLCIPQSSTITRASPSDCLMSYLGHSLGGGYSSTEMQSADWAKRRLSLVLWLKEKSIPRELTLKKYFIRCSSVLIKKASILILSEHTNRMRKSENMRGRFLCSRTLSNSPIQYVEELFVGEEMEPKEKSELSGQFTQSELKADVSSLNITDELHSHQGNQTDSQCQGEMTYLKDVERRHTRVHVCKSNLSYTVERQGRREQTYMFKNYQDWRSIYQDRNEQWMKY